jgi:LysM repeat protein
MTKKRIRHVAYWTILSITAFALTGTLTGCRTFANLNPFNRDKQPPLLGDRGVVPPAYNDPSDAPSQMKPVEPALDIEPIDVNGDSGMDMLPDLGTDEDTLPDTTVTTPDIEVPPVVETSTLTYEVQKGDSLWKIGRAYGVTFQELAAYNNLDPKAILKVGSVLRIPPGGKFVPESERPPVRQVRPSSSNGGTSGGTITSTTTLKTRTADANGIYTVKANDNLWVIARSFKTKVSELRSLNNLTSDTLQIGDKLKIPGLAAGSSSTSNNAVTPVPDGVGAEPASSDNSDGTGAVTGGENEVVPTPTTSGTELPPTLEYTISENDTLQGIADMYNVKVQDIIDANTGIATDADLRPGTNIKIPFN